MSDERPEAVIAEARFEHARSLRALRLELPDAVAVGHEERFRLLEDAFDDALAVLVRERDANKRIADAARAVRADAWSSRTHGPYIVQPEVMLDLIAAILAADAALASPAEPREDNDGS